MLPFRIHLGNLSVGGRKCEPLEAQNAAQNVLDLAAPAAKYNPLSYHAE